MGMIILKFFLFVFLFEFSFLEPSLSSESPIFGNIANLSQPVYISVTTIGQRLAKGRLYRTLRSIIMGKVVPNHLYVFLSREPYLLDRGVNPEGEHKTAIARIESLKEYYNNLTIVYTRNIGPHRKLIPLLKRKWKEDCVIITIDDDQIYESDFASSLLTNYVLSGRDAIIANQVRRIGFCIDPHEKFNFSPYMVSKTRLFVREKKIGSWPIIKDIREMLVLPIGFGGILYRPRFFHRVVFDKVLMNLTRSADDLHFRLSTIINGIEVIATCPTNLINGPRCTTYSNSMRHTDNEIARPMINDHKVRNLRQVRNENSLATIFNSIQGDGNTLSWMQGAEFLLNEKHIDVWNISVKFLNKERPECDRTNPPYIKDTWNRRSCGLYKCLGHTHWGTEAQSE
jgi:hypothetical protein